MLEAWIKNYPDKAFSVIFGKTIEAFLQNFFPNDSYSDIENFIEETWNSRGTVVKQILKRYGKFFYPTLRERILNFPIFKEYASGDRIIRVILQENVCLEEAKKRQKEFSEEIGKMEKFPKKLGK